MPKSACRPFSKRRRRQGEQIVSLRAVQDAVNPFRGCHAGVHGRDHRVRLGWAGGSRVGEERQGPLAWAGRPTRRRPPRPPGRRRTFSERCSPRKAAWSCVTRPISLGARHPGPAGRTGHVDVFPVGDYLPYLQSGKLRLPATRARSARALPPTCRPTPSKAQGARDGRVARLLPCPARPRTR
jgi:hypothetical protein